MTGAAPGADTLAVTWGDPHSAFTYSGVPWHLFAELDRRGRLVGRADADLTRPSDLVARGLVDPRRSWRERRPRRSAVWRYLPRNIDLLSERFAAVERAAPPHEVVLQFGVAGVPRESALVAHIEIPVEVAVSTPDFARSYGYDRLGDRALARAIEGQRRFVDRCDLVWTNSPWTVAGFVEAGYPAEKLRWYPPGCGIADPGAIDRDWRPLHVLFVGKDWVRKGGPPLVEAFRAVRARRPDARLTIVGCTPEVDEPGVEVLGYLSKDVPGEARAFAEAIRSATVFCMPSTWESTGVVYMEASVYGLPVVMVGGQGREELFPEGAITVDEPDPELLASALLDLGSDPARMRAVGASGRGLVLERYTWPTVADRVEGFLDEARRTRSGTSARTGRA